MVATSMKLGIYALATVALAAAVCATPHDAQFLTAGAAGVVFVILGFWVTA